KESLKLSYSRSLAQFVQLTINGKQITTPATPLDAKRSVIEFEISKDTLPQIWKSGAISTEVPAAQVDANSNASTTVGAPQPKTTPLLKPPTNSNMPANSATKPTGTVKTNPTPTPWVITIPPARPATRPPQN